MRAIQELCFLTCFHYYSMNRTPLQNNLMELWSLLHFLMPYIFRSRKEFSYWFANPMNSMIEGASNQNDDVVHRLHGIIRPFILRRLKKDVETQMPGKFEHIIRCQLSRRQVSESALHPFPALIFVSNSFRVQSRCLFTKNSWQDHRHAKH